MALSVVEDDGTIYGLPGWRQVLRTGQVQGRFNGRHGWRWTARFLYKKVRPHPIFSW